MPNVNSASEERITTEEFGMPLRYYYVNSSEAEDLVMPAHWHYEIEIQLFVRGDVLLTIDNTELKVNENDIVFIPSQSIHFGDALTDHIEVHNYIFHTEMLCALNHDNNVQKYFMPFINRVAEVPYIINTSDAGYSELRRCLTEIANLVQRKPICHELLIRSQLTEFFVHLYNNGYVQLRALDSAADRNYLAVRDAITYIEENFSEPLTVEEIAANAGFSKSRFMAIFKEFTNTTCKKYINTCRLNEAKKMLIETSLTVLEIAISCGYHNISLFNREFKKVYNCTPSEYRKRNRSIMVCVD